MDKTVTCIAATTSDEFNNDHNNNDTFSLDNLKQLQEDIFNRYIPIVRDFDDSEVLGQVESAQIVQYGKLRSSDLKKYGLVIIANLKEWIEPTYIVPGFKILDCDIDTEKNILTYLDIELQCMSLAHNPAEKNVTKFEDV